MKFLLPLFLLISRFLYSQEYSNTDIIGIWEVNRCELLSNGEMIKSAYLSNSGIHNKVIEGKYAGKLDEDINSIIDAIIGSVITINEDSSVSWDGTNNKLDFNNAFWQLKPTGELLICKFENRFRMRPLLFTGRIMVINNEGMRVRYFESGFEVRLLLAKK
jgi:hypothetical protein